MMRTGIRSTLQLIINPPDWTGTSDCHTPYSEGGPARLTDVPRSRWWGPQRRASQKGVPAPNFSGSQAALTKGSGSLGVPQRTQRSESIKLTEDNGLWSPCRDASTSPATCWLCALGKWHSLSVPSPPLSRESGRGPPALQAAG